MPSSYNLSLNKATLVCFNAACRETYSTEQVVYSCSRCGGLLEAAYPPLKATADELKQLWRTRRMSNLPIDQSGVWRYREIIDFLESPQHIVTLREGNTPLLPSRGAGQYAGLDLITFKHQGFNPTGSFKDNGMTCGASQALSLGMRRVACVSTGNTSASMAAYASAAGMQPIIFIPHGNISYGKLAQALEYGAVTMQVEDANFDQILKLVRVLSEELGIYLLNSINPFRIEGQKTIVVEMLDQRDWVAPDWIVLPGGNLGNVSAFGKGLRELVAAGFIRKSPRLAVVQAEKSAPFYHYMTDRDNGFAAVSDPKTLATAIKIGDPVSWPKAQFEIEESGGVVEMVTEQEIADAKAQIGLAGIGCEPASAASLAGVKKLAKRGLIRDSDDVVGVLTGNLLKDPDYIYGYHTGALKTPDGSSIASTFGNSPITVPNDAARIASLLAADYAGTR